MKTRLVLFLAVCLVLGFAASGFAVEYGTGGGGGTEMTAPAAPGGEMAPALTGNETEKFNAGSPAEAQEICDKVASRNNKSRCVAKPIEVTGTTQQEPSVFYCTCE